MIENLCQIPVEVEYASEFRYRNPVLSPGDVVFAISQSGETADTLAAIQEAKQKGASVFGIVNVVGSSIARATEAGIYIHAGPENWCSFNKSIYIPGCGSSSARIIYGKNEEFIPGTRASKLHKLLLKYLNKSNRF